ncbi:MAG: hypothetical protein ABI772_06905 [Bacteroidota bacterium]
MKHRSFLILVMAASLCYSSTIAQSFKSDSLFVPGNVKQYQFNLDKPALQIDDLKYEQSGDPIKGGLTRDGGRVIMDNYKKGQRVKARVTYADGTSEEITRSPCYIDPVKFEL